MSVATTYRVLGIPMQHRNTRRKLVVLVYSILLLMCAIVCFLSMYRVRWTMVAFFYCLYIPLFVAMFVFGGNGRFGLIKPFVNKLQRPQMDIIRLQLSPEIADSPDRSLLNDERELGRRDRAHYLAYQPLSLVPMLIVVLAAWTLNAPYRFSPFVLSRLIFGVGLISTVLAMTLPSAIILWTEPDIETF